MSFFFQAEDGIRDIGVTGVQTCALPILYNRPTDMRKSFHTLSGIVTDVMGHDPCNGNVYIFMNRARNRIKLLHWEAGGMVLYSKLLERSEERRVGKECRSRWSPYH